MVLFAETGDEDWRDLTRAQFPAWLRVQQWQGGSCLVMLGCMRAVGNLAVVANSGYVSMKSPMLCVVIVPPKQRCRNLKRAVETSAALVA